MLFRSTTIVRAGAVFVEGWLVIPLELKEVPERADGVGVFVSVNLASGTSPVFYVKWGEQYTMVSAGRGKPFRNAAPWLGKTVEVAINAATLGFSDGQWPAGATVTLNVHASGASASCMTTAPMTPGLTLP